MTWLCSGELPGEASGIYARRDSADGESIGGEFHVSTTTAGDRGDPAVASACVCFAKTPFLGDFGAFPNCESLHTSAPT